MNNILQDLMRKATRLTQSGRLADATAAIQRALRGDTAAVVPREKTPEPAPLVLDDCVFEIGPQASGREEGTAFAHFADAVADVPPADRAAGAGEFIAGSHTEAGQTREYKLYVPPGAAGRSLPLVVMLHGCTQDPDDFAAGTGMNEHARAQGFFVLYPAQSQAANPSRCWNWFQPADQQRGHGEPALLAGMTRAVIAAHRIDPGRVYVAGLSAGGAMAAIVGAAYPELFAAVGVHSGLPRGAAGNLAQALAAMKKGAGAAPRSQIPQVAVPTIVFHGDRDRTVHSRNGEQLIAAVRGGAGGDANAPRIEPGVSARGRRYTRSTHAADGAGAAAEHWVLHGAGHAWSGGHPAGSYTDANGPDATHEMLRFFFAHPGGQPH